MNNKKFGQIIFDFLTYVLFIFLLIVAFYFIISDGFTTFKKILMMLAPGAVFLLPAVLYARKWFQLDEDKRNYDFTLYLTQGDKIILDILMYGAASLILFLAALNQGLDFVDIAQALVALLAIAGYKIWLFKRAKQR